LAAAGALHLVFGVAVIFPLLPPIDLRRVHDGIAFVWVAAGVARSERGAEAVGTRALSAAGTRRSRGVSK
jgi:hypothetical protein